MNSFGLLVSMFLLACLGLLKGAAFSETETGIRMSSFVCMVSPIVRIMVILSVLTITHYGGLTTNLFCYVLHRLHELLLMELLGCVVVLCLCIGWLIVVV